MEPGSEVSDEGRALLDVASRLTREVFAPAERELDALPPGSQLREHPAYRAAMDKALDAGFRRLLLPAESGGLEAPLGLTLAVADTLAQGAPGFASSLLGDALLSAVAAQFADPDAPQATALHEIIADTDAAEPRLAWAFAGADGHAGAPVRLSGGLDVDLQRDGFVAPGSGATSGLCLRQVAGAASATHLLLVAVPEVVTYLLPLDGADVVPVRRLGLRVHPHADIDIDRAALTPQRVAIGAQRGGAFLEALFSVLALGAAARGAGLLDFAHAQALDFARTRVQGGRPIVEHETVAEVLWEARANVTVIRSAVAHAAASASALPDLATALSIRDLARRAVTKGAVEMTELLGGYGITTEYPLEKLYRDAQTLAQGGGRVLGPGVFTHLTLT